MAKTTSSSTDATKRKAPPRRSAAKGGKPLVIVESPAKARTIGKILGPDYMIEASVGHIRDLPASAAEIPAELKKQPWARLGIDIDNDFQPLYVVSPGKREQIRKLKALLKEADLLYLATDEDREGESISWHLEQVLAPKVEVRRLVFHEITKEAILEALNHPRAIDANLVEAQETRRLVDRLYGYSVSPLLWKKIRPRLSAGRVQSVAVRLIVERERERIRFRSAEYWDLIGGFQGTGQDTSNFEATLVSVGGRRLAIGKDFEPETGRLKPANDPPLHLTAEAAETLRARLAGETGQVLSLEQKPYSERPAAPFTTSTLQQEAGRKLRFTAQRAMRAAQRLYENGHITYMRTDSTTLSQEALNAARTLILENYGAENLPEQPRLYASKVKNAQEAHEAIRPAGTHFDHWKDLESEMGEDERKIYRLIWERTVASQMKDARGQRTTLQVGLSDAVFQTSGKIIEFPGFRLAYVEDAEDAEAAVAETDRVLPAVRPGDRVHVLELRADGHTTQPPARLTEANLVRELEARGIGRPSTYASIIETIQAREYCFKKGTALVPTFTAFAVVNLLDQYLHHLVDYDFTARMEGELDEISNGELRRLDYLRHFYHGNGLPGLKNHLEQVEAKINPREVCSIPLGPGVDGQVVEVRVGRYGPFLSSGDRRASIPDDIPPDEMTLERAEELLVKGEEGPRSLGIDPESGSPIYVKVGRFGPYFQLGDASDQPKAPKPKMASLLDGMTPETVDLETALRVLALPRRLGEAEKAGGEGEPAQLLPIVATNGRFGPYLLWGKETRSIPKGESPIEITLERALELFAQPKTRGRATRQAPPPLRTLGPHPKTGAEIRLLDGRYGPYVTDGTTNASLGRGETIEELTLERALELIEARAAAGPPKKRRGAAPRSGGTRKKKSG